MNQLFVNGKIKPTFFVILMLSVSILSGCVSDEGVITEVNNNENNNGENETANNTGNETANNTGNETAENTLPLSNQCLTGHSNLAMHIHPWLNLTISETKIPIPENMGIDTFACPNAMHLLHTHDDTGKLHIETYEPISLNLSLFFAVWNISQPGDSTFDILFLDPDNVTIIIDGVEQIIGIDEIIFEDGIFIDIIYETLGAKDTDADGLSDIMESILHGTDPFHPDTDGDGISDGWEVYYMLDPLNSSDWHLDQDGDGLNNTQEFEKGTNPNDSDTDGDGENDDTDIFPQDPNNGQFVDSDQDGYNDSIEYNCQSDYQDFNSIPQDTDGDGICDPLDPVNDLITMWGNNSAHFLYVKPDLIENSNIENAKPYQIEFAANPMAEQNPVVLTQICFKDEGHIADVWSSFILGPFPYDIISWNIYNTNGQSIGMFVSNDNLTQSSNMIYPTVISTQDTENQSSGHLEAEVIDSQYYSCEFDYTDTDGDGVLDWTDAFPNDANEWEDLDGDGIGNNADLDDDGDSCEDNMDWAPLNSTECFDTDGDGIGDNADPHPWLNNTGNGTFTMNYTMIGISYGHEIYWLSGRSECPCYAYYYTTTPDLVWTTGNRSPVISHENMPNVDSVLGLMGLTINNLSVSSYPMDLGTDTQTVEWDYNPNTGIEWRNLSSNLSILYVDDKPLFSINASMMLYLDYYPMIAGEDPTMWGESSFSPISSMLLENDALIYQQLFDAFFEDFGENNINYLFNTQDAIITNDYIFTSSTPDTSVWLDSIISNSGANEVPGGLFDSVISEVNVEQSQNGITMSKTVKPSENKMVVLSERIKEDEDPYFNE